MHVFLRGGVCSFCGVFFSFFVLFLKETLKKRQIRCVSLCFTDEKKNLIFVVWVWDGSVCKKKKNKVKKGDK